LVKKVSFENKVFLAGAKYGYFADPRYTNRVEVYDGTSNSWTSLSLSNKREVGGAGAAGDYVFFAGGTGRDDISGPVYIYRTVDIFNSVTGSRIVNQLTKARGTISVGAAGTQILFAGGWYWDITYTILETDRVDIYDVSTSTWSTATLSEKRQNMAVATVGDLVIFAGGLNSNIGLVKNVDIYNTTSKT